MNRELLDKWCERGILGLVLSILVFGPLAMGAVETPDFLVIQGLSMLVMLLWAVRLWINPKPQLLWTPVCWVVLAFSAYAIVRYLTADIEYVARLEMVQVLVCAILFLVIVNNLHRQEHTQIITLTLVFLAMGISFYAIFQFVTGSDKVWNLITPYRHRGTGTYISPNHLAGFLEMILPLGLATLLVSRAKHLVKILAAYASLVILAGIAVTVSRGGWASTALMLTIFFGVLISHRTYRIPSILLLIVLIGGGIFFFPRAQMFKARIQELTAHDQFNDSARFELWDPALRLWRENVWWGIGPDHYNYRFPEFRPQLEQQQPDRVHNDYLNTLTDYGVAGAALVGTALLLLFLGLGKTWKYVRGKPGDLGSTNSNKFALVLGASLGLLAILFHSVVDFNMHIPANALLAVSLMALLSGASRFATERYWNKVGVAKGALLTLLLLAGVSYLGWQGDRAAREYFWLRQCSWKPNLSIGEPSPAQMKALGKAFEIEPDNFKTAFAIGEGLRRQAWGEGDNYEQTAREAIKYFDQSTKLNPYEGYGFLGQGMCLDKVDETEKATTFYQKAFRLDPNGYWTVDWMAWHFVQTGEFASARVWFERSKRLEWNHNMIADSYMPLVTKWLLSGADSHKTTPLSHTLTKQ